MATFRERYPNFRSMRMIFSGEPGSGKSVVLASVPVPTGKRRVAMDNEDSMAYLDNKDKGDIYTPNRQQFSMVRTAFPDLETYGKYFQAVKKQDNVGAYLIDNIAIFQDIIKSTMINLAPNAVELRRVFRLFDAESVLPNNGLISKVWPYNQDGNFWTCAKEIPKQIILLCMKKEIHFLGSTEEGNVWQDYGKPNAKIVGKKAKIWDAWYRYTDMVISLKRDVNSHNPPVGQLYPNQPKMRLQGFNPSFTMDWPGFIAELKAANQRTEVEVPESARVNTGPEVFEEE
jgi:hypothetical protein